MKLSIITINYNDAEGLRKTLDSVLMQSYTAIEHCIVDGASSDQSVEVIEEYYDRATAKGITVKWVSEPDSGIYNAMNKGIRMASGEYLQFLNSGDRLYSEDVTERMLQSITPGFSIFSGDMQLEKDGKKEIWRGARTEDIRFTTLYKGSINHSPSYIKRSLFEKYGYYDESLKIVSDWKFFLECIVFHNEPIKLVNIPITVFDLNGVSSINLEARCVERERVLNSLMPKLLLDDLAIMYPNHAVMTRITHNRVLKFIVNILYRILLRKDKIWYGLKNK